MNFRFLFRLTFLCLFMSTQNVAVPGQAQLLADQQKEARGAISNFGLGMAEAFRQRGVLSDLVESGDVIQWTQRGTAYSINWVAKKSAPEAPFPAHMILGKTGVVLPGSIVIGRSSAEECIGNLGKPHAKKGSKYIYHLPNYLGDDLAIFSFRKGILVSVEWSWFTE